MRLEDYFEVHPVADILLHARESPLSRKVFQSLSGYAHGQLERTQKLKKTWVHG